LLDVLVPVPHQNLQLVPDCLDALRTCTDVPFRVLVMVDGAAEEDLRSLQDYLNAFEPAWRLTNERIAVGLNAILNEGLSDCVQKLTAIIGPETRLLDRQWFGKVKQIFDRDPIAGIVDFYPDTRSTTHYPVKRAHNRHPLMGCRFAVVQTNYARKMQLYGLVDPMVYWSKMVHSQGGSAWHVAAVSYTEVEHHDHELWRPKVAAGS
jgi:hypothetical protein